MNASRVIGRLLLPLVATVSLACVVRGQAVIAPVNPPPPTLAEAASRTSRVPGSSIDSALSSDLPLFAFGDFSFHPSLTYRLLEADGIQVGPGHTVNSTTQSFSPGLTIDAGTHWHLFYAPTWTYYSNAAFKDSVDHAADATGTYDFIDWKVTIVGSYAASHPVLVEVASQAREVLYSGGIATSHPLGDKTQWDFAITETWRDATTLNPQPDTLSSDSREWASTNYIKYRVTPRLFASVGGSVGYSSPTAGPGMLLLRPEVVLTWTPTEKVTVNTSAGYEQRKIRGSFARSMRSPTYSASVRYRPIDATTILLESSRSMGLTDLAAVVAKSTSWRAGIEQRFLGFLYLSGIYSRQDTNYLDTRSDLVTRRRDRIESTEGRVSVPVLKRGSISVFYRRSTNSSSNSLYSFTSDQFGFDASVRF